VVAFATDAHGFLEGVGANRDDEILLESKLVASVGASVDHIEARDWQDHWSRVASQLGDVLVKRHALALCGSLGSSQGNTQDSVCSQLVFVWGAIKLAHEVIQLLLVPDIHALDGTGQGVVHGSHGRQTALADVAALVVIAELACLIDTCGGARWHSSAHGDTALGGDVDLNSWVATAVEDLAGDNGVDGKDLRHCSW